MNVGLPGTGLGGVFYLLMAFFMPFFELYKTLRGESSLARWHFVLRQLFMAASIIGGMWLVGLILGLLIQAPAVSNPETITHFVQQTSSASIIKMNVFHIAPIFLSLSTLGLIFLLTRLMGLVIHARSNQ